MKAKHLHFPAWIALALVMPASADVIYSNLQDISIPATFDGLYLNVETGAWNTDMAAPVAGWDINPFYGGKAFANSPDFQPVRSGTGSSSSILNLAAGTSVGTGSVFSTFVQGAGGETPGAPGYGFSQMLTGSGGNFTAGTEGYLGFRLNGTNYGSMRMVLTNNTSGAVIKDWAYDTTGAAIKTGWIKTDIVSPTTQTVTLNPGTSEAFTLGSTLADASGSITNSVVKTGAGTTTLKVANSYTGTTAVNEGKLVVNGSITGGGAVSVAGGATLGGTGSVAGATTLAAAATLAPTAQTDGNHLTLGTTTFTAGSIFEWDMSPADPAVDPTLKTNQGSYGQVAAGTTTGTSIFTIVLGSGSYADAFWNTNKTWSNIYTSSGLTDLSALFTSIAGSSLAYDSGTKQATAAGEGYFTFNGSSTMSWTAVPEPTSALAGLLITAGLLRRRRA